MTNHEHGEAQTGVQGTKQFRLLAVVHMKFTSTLGRFFRNKSESNKGLGKGKISMAALDYSTISILVCPIYTTFSIYILSILHISEVQSRSAKYVSQEISTLLSLKINQLKTTIWEKV